MAGLLRRRGLDTVLGGAKAAKNQGNVPSVRRFCPQVRVPRFPGARRATFGAAARLDNKKEALGSQAERPVCPQVFPGFPGSPLEESLRDLQDETTCKCDNRNAHCKFDGGAICGTRESCGA
jgi:hypothetical protein